MTPYADIYKAADLANAAEINGDHRAHKHYSQETSRLIQKRLAEICGNELEGSDTSMKAQLIDAGFGSAGIM
jgi:hypothetical protein